MGGGVRENTRKTLQFALTHLRVHQQEIETAIAAILAVLGEGDLVPARPVAKARPAPARSKTPTEAIFDYLEHHGPSQPKAIRAATKLGERECKLALQQLSADELIVGEGATSQRRYRLVTTKVRVKAARTSPPPPLVATDDEYETVWNGASPQPMSAANGGLS